MGRHLSERHLQALRAEIRQRILALDFEANGNADDVRRLIAALGLQARATLPTRTRLKELACELRQALVEAREPARQDTGTLALDGWIDRHLLHYGPDLMIAAESRQAWMARQRDTARRTARSARGMVSARIEMRQEAWARLRVIQADFRAADGVGLTRSQVLERLIDDRIQTLATNKAKRAIRKHAHPAGKDSLDTLPGLFSGMSAPKQDINSD